MLDTWDIWDSSTSSAGQNYIGSAQRMAAGIRSNSQISRSRAVRNSGGKYGATSRVAGLVKSGRLSESVPLCLWTWQRDGTVPRVAAGMESPADVRLTASCCQWMSQSAMSM